MVWYGMGYDIVWYSAQINVLLFPCVWGPKCHHVKYQNKYFPLILEPDDLMGTLKVRNFEGRSQE